MAIRGIDVSGYQSTSYPLDGHDFVIVKATEGTSYVNPRHDEQVTRARNHDRVVGHYHFLSPGSGINAQVDYFLDHIAARNDEILALDWEDTGVSSAEKDDAIDRLKSKAGGRRVILYCNVDFWVNRDRSGKAGDGLWIAHYNGDPGNPGIRDDWLIHQYTDNPIDTNLARFDSRAAMRDWATRRTGDVEDDDAPIRALFATADGYTRHADPGEWTLVAFNRRFDDGRWSTRDPQTSFLFGPCHYTASLGLRVTGLSRGDRLQVRVANYEEKPGEEGAFERTIAMPTHAVAHDEGDGRFVHTWTGYVPGARKGRLRAEVHHEGKDRITIEEARVEALYWPA